ncbi:molybdate ABC transporter substrate-binding protein [Hydrogenimonas cancrithermarum]|uniref:Molybdate ABC transporter substrate-binding protein n=1 Tax=Hydrogenimonas cancrithermarum TaxID=2993563 RepID=A0ABN6WV06_9BACT|nr:molybdate ABC transporter substrate-binding protein [Hydrogenimonas cancrithermarum]BDY12921.1 molybdate ABC transporter substrate-binding protein [Hydrogenimonas cancrithermarum]BDY13038.1 molybdate ABC transporter substrate-binding protein [Hydrogenimonas cancrithermarum]
MKKSLLLFLVSLAAMGAVAEEITVATAANVQFAMAELQKTFEKETGITVRTVISSSGKLTAQIKSGAPFDLFLSANMKYPEYLRKHGFAVTEPRVYAYGSLVIWTLKPIDTKAGLKSLTNPAAERIAIPNPKNAPYGIQALKAMQNAGVYDAVKSKLIYAESVSQTNQYIVSKAADIGMTAKSVVLSPKVAGKGSFVDVDPALYSPIQQGVVILKHGEKNHPNAVRAFYDFLFSPQGRKIFKTYGYITP